MTRRILSNTTALGFVIAIVASTTAAVDKNWLTHFYGRVKADSYEYFVVDVPRGVFAVDVSMVLSELGARTPPTLFLQKDAFATESSYDVALNTTRKSPYISATLTNLKHGRYYATVWGGNMPGTVTTFGVGPSTNMWWYLDFTFRACQHVDMLGPACTTASVALPSRQQHGYSGSNDADGRGCIDSTPALFSFELAQPAASLDVTLSIQDPSILVAWALYLDTATPFPSDALPVRNGTSATRSFHIPRPQTGKWMVRVALPQPAETIGKCNPNIDQPTGGIPFTVSWNTTETCDPLDGDLCAASWTPLNQLRNAANPLDDYVVDASFSSNQPLKPSMNVSNVVVAYDVQVEPVYAGTNVVLHMATTALVSNFSVFIRVNGWPTLTEYDYTYNASQASRIGGVGSQSDPINPSVVAFDALKQQATSSGGTQFLEFPPIVFPKIGHWYIVVRPDTTVATTNNKNEWGVALQLQTNACPPHNVCSNHGTCVVKNSYQGMVYGECQCAYGYGGRDCSVLVHTDAQRTGRTWLLLLSNAAILPAAILSWTRKLYVEAVLFAGLGVISGVYHACDLNLYCMFPYAFLQSMDFTFTFNAIMLGFIHLSGAFKHVKAGMQVFVLVALVFMTTYNATSMKNWVALGGVIIVQFVATWSYYLTLAKHRLHTSMFETLKRFVFYSDNFDFRFLLLGVALWGSAFGCFFTESGNSYWLIHSIWHFTAMLAAFAFMGLRKNIRYRCVGEDEVDVLSHEATESARLDKPAFTTTNVVLMSEHDMEAAPGTTQTCTST